MSPQNGVRVLYLCSARSFSCQQLNRKLAEIAQCWRDGGYDVRHLCGGDIVSSSSKDTGSYGSPEVYEQWYRKASAILPLVRSMSEWRDIRHDKALLQHLRMVYREWKPDIVWERSCRLHRSGLAFARQIGVPYVLEWKDHLVDYDSSFFRRRALRVEDLKNHEADFVVVESGVLRDELGRYGMDRGKIIVAHNAVRSAQFARDETDRGRIRRELNIDDATVLVGYLGSYAFYHDTTRLVKAANIIQKEFPHTEIRVLMIGAGKEWAMTRQLAEDLNLLGGRVVMRSGVPQHEVPGILSALDVAVLPGSTDIICPIKIQEYMACELPVVAPDYACNREVIQNGETGLLFRPEDEFSLAQSIVQLATNRDWRTAMGRRAREEVVLRFSWEATWGAALNTVRTVIGEGMGDQIKPA